MSKSRRMKQDERLTQMLMPRVMAATRYEMLKERHEKKKIDQEAMYTHVTYGHSVTFPKALWPGVNKWFSEIYRTGDIAYRSIFSEETTDTPNNS